MDARRRYAEVALEIGLGGCATMDAEIRVDERQVLTLQSGELRIRYALTARVVREPFSRGIMVPHTIERLGISDSIDERSHVLRCLVPHDVREDSAQ